MPTTYREQHVSISPFPLHFRVIPLHLLSCYILTSLSQRMPISMLSYDCQSGKYPRCAQCRGAVSEGTTTASYVKMLRRTGDVILPQEFDGAAKVFLRCRHQQHSVCVLTSGRCKRLSFLIRYIRTLCLRSSSMRFQDVSWCESDIANAWNSGLQPYLTCKLCATKRDGYSGSMSPLSCGYPTTRLEICN